MPRDNTPILNGMLNEIKRRQADYDTTDYVEARDKLIATWRAAHPLAAQEEPSCQHPLEKTHDGEVDNAEQPEYWHNDIYQITVRRWTLDRVFGTNGGTIQIGINSHDGTARHDWRDFQSIKNQIAGEECEAFELYPAESRLMDPSNYYTLWCFPGLKRMRVGSNEPRRVFNSDEALAPQRGFSV